MPEGRVLDAGSPLILGKSDAITPAAFTLTDSPAKHRPGGTLTARDAPHGRDRSRNPARPSPSPDAKLPTVGYCVPHLVPRSAERNLARALKKGSSRSGSGTRVATSTAAAARIVGGDPKWSPPSSNSPRLHRTPPMFGNIPPLKSSAAKKERRAEQGSACAQQMNKTSCGSNPR
jgi:hypothetical protein